MMAWIFCIQCALRQTGKGNRGRDIGTSSPFSSRMGRWPSKKKEVTQILQTRWMGTIQSHVKKTAKTGIPVD